MSEFLSFKVGEGVDVYSIKDCLHKTLITVINAYMYHLYMLFRSVRPIALYMAQISCQMKSGRHVASFWGEKGGIFYKILTSRKKVTSQNYKNSNLWRGKKQVGTYMYCTYNFYFNFFKYRRGLLVLEKSKIKMFTDRQTNGQTDAAKKKIKIKKATWDFSSDQTTLCSMVS